MNFRKNIGKESPGFQMAPMVDVMFLLLIFFMVSSIYYQLEKNLDVNVPQADSGTKSERVAGEIIINVTKDGQYYINNINKSLNDIEELLGDIVNEYNGSQPIIIRCDENTAYKHYVRILDICQKLGIEEIHNATEPGANTETSE